MTLCHFTSDSFDHTTFYHHLVVWITVISYGYPNTRISPCIFLLGTTYCRVDQDILSIHVNPCLSNMRRPIIAIVPMNAKFFSSKSFLAFSGSSELIFLPTSPNSNTGMELLALNIAVLHCI